MCLHLLFRIRQISGFLHAIVKYSIAPLQERRSHLCLKYIKLTKVKQLSSNMVLLIC